MRAGELLLHHQHLEDRVRSLEDERVHLQDRLANDPESDRLRVLLSEAMGAHEAAVKRLESLDREVSAHRTRMRAHERELMSGRVRSPSDLTRMSTEVDHMKAALVAEEDAELEVMTQVDDTRAEVESLEMKLAAAGERRSAAKPSLEGRLSMLEQEVTTARAELEATWEQIPSEYQAAYRRLSRISSPVAPVARGECGGCHVALTASELQQVRRGDHLVTCQSCSRILVAV